MLTDMTRTGTYQRAIYMNSPDFQNKVVCDVGTGTGILSFFAAHAGASKVFAVEASGMADYAKLLVESNGYSGVINVLKGRCEEVEVPEKVDILISEPMGVMLVNERMLETYLYARKWLKEGGTMFPRFATIFTCPFSDELLFFEFANKSVFWTQKSFYGVDMSALQAAAVVETFRQPVVECFDARVLQGEPYRTEFDFLTMDEKDLHEVACFFSCGHSPCAYPCAACVDSHSCALSLRSSCRDSRHCLMV
eukprot:m.165521 g.165521  ORF g.165521 m.165521 type:complete len:251 (+) comp53121_c0_seq9:453-1205(+)